GMLAPIVMGTIGQQQGTRSFDAGGIANLLASQKDNIAAALPAGFANLLGGTGLLDSLGGAARTATAAAGQTTRVTTSGARAIGDTGQRAAGAAALNWLSWLIPLLAIVALLIYFFAKPTEQVVQPGVPPIPSLTVGGLDIAKQVTDSVTSLRTALGGITDAASARAALPKLQEVTAQIDKVDGLLGQLSPEQRKVLAGIVNPIMPSLNQLYERVWGTPGVAELWRPKTEARRPNPGVLPV